MDGWMDAVVFLKGLSGRKRHEKAKCSIVSYTVSKI